MTKYLQNVKSDIPINLSCTCVLFAYRLLGMQAC